jgi:hypothetical protein
MVDVGSAQGDDDFVDAGGALPRSGCWAHATVNAATTKALTSHAILRSATT